MDIRLCGACAVLLLAACAGTPPANESESAQVSQAVANGDLVCEDQSTGTHVRRQEVCRTREEMERERAAATSAMERKGRVPGTIRGN